MKALKILTSAVSAAAVVGAVGLAYAQTSSTTTNAAPPAGTSAETMQNQGTTNSVTQPPSTTGTDSANLPTERPAQADRN